MRTASVGLTLTCASRLFLMEPLLRLADEQQAISRLHRFGQSRPLVVRRFALKGTVEEKLLFLHSGRNASAGSGAPRAVQQDLNSEVLQELLA